MTPAEKLEHAVADRIGNAVNTPDHCRLGSALRRDAARAAIAAVREVLQEPTPEMRLRGADAEAAGYEDCEQTAVDVWQAMLGAVATGGREAGGE